MKQWWVAYINIVITHCRMNQDKILILSNLVQLLTHLKNLIC